MVEGVAREEHVLGHRAEGMLAKTVHIAVLTHPVLTAEAETALPAGHDLFGHGQVAQPQTVLLAGAYAQGDDLAHELVPGNDRRLAVGDAVLIPPEHRRALVALGVAGADAGGLDPNHHLFRARMGNVPLLEPVVPRPVANDGLHGPG